MTHVMFTVICSSEDDLSKTAKDLVRKGLRPVTYRLLKKGDAETQEIGLAMHCDVREKYKLEGYRGRMWNLLFTNHYLHSLNGSVLELVQEIPKEDKTLKWTGFIFSSMFGQFMVCQRYNKGEGILYDTN